MNKTLPLSADVPGWRELLSDPVFRVGAVIGLAPLFAGLIFRTYGYHVSPTWAEGLRQLDAPFIFIEVGVVLWARHLGLNYRAIFDRLDRSSQIALVIFLGTFWIGSAFISADPGYSLVRASFWFVHIAFGFAVFHLSGSLSQAGLLRFGTPLIAGFVMFLPLMIVHLINAPDPALVRGGKIIWSSAIPGCLSVRHLGIWAALVLACAIGGLYLRDSKAPARRTIYVVIFMATATLFWSGTRAGVYGVGGGLLILLATLRALPPWRPLAVAGAAAALGICVSELWLPPDVSFGIFSRAAGQASGDFQDLSSGRTVLWASMMQAFAGSPLFGVGEGAIHWLAVFGDTRHVQPHNSLVQMLSSWGLIACMAAGYLMARLLIFIHRMARKDAVLIPLMLTIDCLLLMSLADGVLYFSRFIMWFAGAAAVVFAVASRAAAVAERDFLVPAFDGPNQR